MDNCQTVWQTACMTTPEGTAFAATLEAHRLRTHTSFNQLARLVYDRLGAYAPTGETLRTYHRGGVDPAKADILVVAAIAAAYGVRISELSQVIADRIEAMELLLKNRCDSASGTSDLHCRGAA